MQAFSNAIFGPVFAMMGLVYVVAYLTLRERMRQFKALRLHPQKVPSRREFSAAMQDTRCADNLQNLFEVPVMFYVASLGLYATQTVSLWALGLAWLYVLLRIGHSVVHCGRNVVMMRFKFFAASHLVLMLLWVLWGLELLQKT